MVIFERVLLFFVFFADEVRRGVERGVEMEETELRKESRFGGDNALARAGVAVEEREEAKEEAVDGEGEGGRESKLFLSLSSSAIFSISSPSITVMNDSVGRSSVTTGWNVSPRNIERVLSPL